MRTFLTNARDWLCLTGAVALVLYITVFPQRPANKLQPFGVTVNASRVSLGNGVLAGSFTVADGTALPGSMR